MTATAIFSINIASTPIARNFHPEDIELGMDADTGVKARVTKDSARIEVTVQAAFAADAAKWLEQASLI